MATGVACGVAWRSLPRSCTDRVACGVGDMMERAVPSYPFNTADGLCADAAHAAALCTSVICGLQYGLTKAAPRAAAAEHDSTTRIECGGWANLPAEDSRPRLRLRDTWRPRTPPRRYIGSMRVGGPDGRGEVPDPYGGSAPSAVGAELPLLRDT